MVQEQRVNALNSNTARDGRFVLYWMQASQRTRCNHALEYAISRANELNKAIVVYFGLTDRFPEANLRHYHFMLEGLKEVRSSLADRRILMVVRRESPETGVVALSRDASLVVVDRGYLRIQRDWRTSAARNMDCPLVQVESDVIVPVEVASGKEEYSAATFRPKIGRKLPDYLKPLPEQEPRFKSLEIELDSLDNGNLEQVLAGLDIDRSVKPAPGLRGGTSEAEKHLQGFLEKKLERYPDLRNDPTADYLSNMSPYLHFGQVSPLQIALAVIERGGPGAEAYLEELVVRRELSMNYVSYNPSYDSYQGLPAWARQTLSEHSDDPREGIYTADDFDAARTHDPYWNAAQREMVVTGKMHGYMRMYWGKKIIEWSRTPEEAFETALYLNNKYELDGRDPNGFTGVAWCFGKHDRPWARRAVFGSIRYMSAGGLKRKFDTDGYVKSIEKLDRSQGPPETDAEYSVQG